MARASSADNPVASINSLAASLKKGTTLEGREGEEKERRGGGEEKETRMGG